MNYLKHPNKRVLFSLLWIGSTTCVTTFLFLYYPLIPLYNELSRGSEIEWIRLGSFMEQ
ncbi:hypothetical protein SD78_1240 [Bacillus badius]|nr:hypothetical protein SD78_1240 [Bacillus badius]